MSYYILPKNNNTFLLDPTNMAPSTICTPLISYSIYNYYNQIQHNINFLCENLNDISYNTFDDLIKILNPHEYIFSKVPGTKYSVSKLKSNSNIFYDLFEILLTFNMFDMYKLQNMNILHISDNYEDTIECNEMLRENPNDNIFFSKKIDDETFKLFSDRKLDFLFIDTIDNNLNNYIINLIQTIMVILNLALVTNTHR